MEMALKVVLNAPKRKRRSEKGRKLKGHRASQSRIRKLGTAIRSG